MSRYDVVAVNIQPPRTVRLLAQDKGERDADSIVSMAVWRRGVETEFYAAVQAGSYHDGDQWQGIR